MAKNKNVLNADRRYFITYFDVSRPEDYKIGRKFEIYLVDRKTKTKRLVNVIQPSNEEVFEIRRNLRNTEQWRHPVDQYCDLWKHFNVGVCLTLDTDLRKFNAQYKTE